MWCLFRPKINVEYFRLIFAEFNEKKIFTGEHSLMIARLRIADGSYSISYKHRKIYFTLDMPNKISAELCEPLKLKKTCS